MSKILIIDDREDNLISLGAVLKSLLPECTVITARSGVEGIEKAKAESPDTILLDIKMPGMDGYEVCRRLKEDNDTRVIPVILISAILTGSKDLVKGLDTGADAYLAKPVDEHILAVQVKTTLRMKTAEDILRRQKDLLEDMVRKRTADLVNTNVQLKREIDERKKVAEVLKASEEKYRSLFERMLNGLAYCKMIYDKHKRPVDWIYLDINDAFEKITGLTKEIIGKKVTEAIPRIKEDVPELFETYGKIASTGEPARFIIYLDTLKVWFSVIAYSPQKDYFVSIFEDITERKQTEDALRKSERQKKAILDTSLDRIRLVDRDLRIIWANKTTTREIDLTPEELVGKICYEFFVERDAPCPGCPMIKSLKSGKMEHTVLHQPKSKGFPGDTYWDTYAVPIKDESGNIVNLIEVSRNITDRIKAEEEKEKLDARLRRSQKMEAVSTLAGGIAHDFNNILSAIIGYAQLAQMKLDPGSEPYADLKEVVVSANRAELLIRQILAVGRSQEQERQPMQLKHIVNEALKFLRSTLPSTIEIREMYDEDVGVIDADPTQMHQVLMNLCTNAGHAMERNGGILEVSLRNVDFGLRPGGNADLKAEESKSQSSDHKVVPSGLEPGQYLELTVSDTGYGIAPEIREKIFDPYFTTKEPGVGTGIGLSVVHGIVTQHGGDITVESEPRKGSTFHVYLPLSQAEEEHPEVKEETPFPTGDERILFIDDEAILARMGKQMLEGLGYHVTSMTSSLESLALFKEGPKRFDLVITDTTMPHMPGDILAQKIMELRPDIPVIICTGHSKRISKEKATQMGIRGFLMKPLAMRDLAETVRKALDEK